MAEAVGVSEPEFVVVVSDEDVRTAQLLARLNSELGVQTSWEVRQIADAIEPEDDLGQPADVGVGQERFSDSELLKAHIDGDATAFEYLIRRHQERMFAVALRIMGTPESAADALQDAYMAAFRRANTFRGDTAVTTWLHRLVVNVCLDRLRRMKIASGDVSIAARSESSRENIDQTEDWSERVDHRAMVQSALEQLNPAQRAAVILLDMEGYSVEDAAAMLGQSPGVVKSRAARGRARLRPLLAKLGEVDIEERGR